MGANGNVGDPGGRAAAGGSARWVRVWTLPTAGLDEAAVAPWRGVLDAAELARADRFQPVGSRIEFIAAHALARAALSSVTGHPPQVFAFVPGPHGKPAAQLGDGPAGVAFNLSHTRGLVGVAVAAAEAALGFDLEPIDRAAPLAIAHRYFSAEETAWLEAQPDAQRPEAFFRLWTLKEAFLKATGTGLAQDLASFWFQVHPPAIHFSAPLAGRPEDWAFEQRIVHRGFLAAVALHHPGGGIATHWTELDAAAFAPA